MNVWTNSIKNSQSSFFIIVVVLLLAIIFTTSAKCIASGQAIIPFMAMAGAFFIWSIYFKPELCVVIMIIIFFDLFGFVDPESFLRVKGVFKLKDVILILMLISIIMDIVIKKGASLQRLQSPVNKPLIALMLLVSFGIAYSSLFRGEHLNYSLRIGRVFYYYLIFFIIMYYIRSGRQIRFVIFATFVFASMVSIIYVVQFFLGPHILVTPFGKVLTQRFEGISFARLYLPGFTVVYMGFMIAFWLFVYQGNRTKLFLLLLLGVGVFSNFFRAYWIGTILGILLPAIYQKVDIKLKILKLCVVFFVLIAIFMPAIKYVPYVTNTDVLTLFSSKLTSTFSEFKNKERSYGSRLNYARSRIELLKVRKNFLFGVGFIQGDPFSSTGKRLYEISPISTGGHLGYLDIILYMGLIGLSCFAWFILVILKRLLYIFRLTQSGLYKATIMGFIGFLILCIVVSISHSPLTTIIGIVPISVFMGLSEAMLKVEQKQV